MGEEQELDQEAIRIYRAAIDQGADDEQALRVARLFLQERSSGPGIVGGTARSFAQGATFGASDEIRGGVRALGAMLPGGRPITEAGDAFREGKAAETAALGKFRQDHPFLSGAADVAGGIATTALTLGVGAGAGITARGAQSARALSKYGAVEGMVVGGLEGGFRSEGGLKDRAIGTAVGATLGGAFGALVGAATPVLSRAGATVAGAAVGGGATYGMTGGSEVQGGLGAMAGGATGRYGGRLGGRIAATITGRSANSAARERAAMSAARALHRSGVTAEHLERLAAEGVDANLLSLTGEAGGAVQRLARGAQSIPSRGSRDITQYMHRESDEAVNRIRDVLQEKTGLKFENIHETMAEVQEAQIAIARPLYAAAHGRSVPREVLGNLLDDPAWRRAYEEGELLARREFKDVTPLATLLPDGSGQIAQSEVSVLGIDYMKRGMDGLIETGIDGNPMSSATARAFADHSRRLLSYVDEFAPEYGAARAAWAGPEAIQAMTRAATNGSRRLDLKAFLREDPRKLEIAMRAMNPSEREAYIRSALDNVRGMVAKRGDTNADLSRVLIGQSGGDVVDSDVRNRMRLLFQTDDDMHGFVREMLVERGRARVRGTVLGGPATARIQAEQADLVGEEVVQSLDPKRAVVEFLRARVGARMQGLTEGTVDELAGMLTGQVSDTSPEILGLVAQALSRRTPSSVVRSGAAAAGATAAPSGRERRPEGSRR